MTVPVPLPTRGATIRFARRLAARLGPGDLVIFEGPLGAGKTYLVRALLRALGVGREHRVTSPTFALVHTYRARIDVWHADLYRLADGDELEPLGLRAARDLGVALLVEWGERFGRELGGDALLARLTPSPRSLTLTSSGPRSLALMETLG